MNIGKRILNNKKPHHPWFPKEKGPKNKSKTWAMGEGYGLCCSALCYSCIFLFLFCILTKDIVILFIHQQIPMTKETSLLVCSCI